MSVFGNIGKAIKKGVTDTGHFIGKVADNPVTKGVTAAALAATGVGAPAAAAIMAGEGLAGGALRKGGNLGTAVKGGATGALEGFGASKLGGLARGAMGALGGNAAGAGGDVVPGQAGSSLLGKLGGLAKGAGSSLLGGLEHQFQNADGSIDWGKLGKLGLAGASLYGQHEATNKANDYFNQQQGMRNDMMKQAQSDYASRQPLRDASFAKLGGLISAPRSGDVFRPFLAKEQSGKAA